MHIEAPRVLVHTDDPTVQRALVRLVLELGYAYRCSCTLVEAQRELAAGQFDMVLIHANRASLLFHGLPTILVDKPVDVARLRRTLRRTTEMTTGVRAGDVLEKFARSTHALTTELFSLYSGARSRGLSLDLGAVQALCASASAQLFARRETTLLGYDATDQSLRGPAVAGPGLVSIPLSLAELERFLAIDQPQEIAERVGPALGAHDLLVVFIGRTPESCALLVVIGSERSPLSTAEAKLLRRFGEFLSLSFAGAQLYKDVLDLSAIDGLTGLYNHRFFQGRLRDEVARADRYEHPVSLLFCDIDEFKRYNDRNGHAAGDAVLARLGQILRNDTGTPVAFRESDVRARYGGEEFAILLPETTTDGAMTTAERLREAVERTPFPGAEAQPHGRLTMSIGVCEYPRDTRDKRGVIEVADRAMYRAKQLGKNRVVSARCALSLVR